MSIIMSAYRGNIASSLPRLIVNILSLWKGLKTLHFWSRKALVNHLTDKISITLLTPSKNDDDSQSFMFNIAFLALECHASLSTVNIIIAIKRHEHQTYSFRRRWRQLKGLFSITFISSALLVMRDLSKENPFNNFWLHESRAYRITDKWTSLLARIPLGILIYITTTFLSFDVFFCILIFTICAF